MKKKAPYRIDDDLKDLIESGVAVIVGTGDADGRPHVSYGWAPRVAADRGTIEVFLDAARADQPLADLRANGRIAMTVCEVVSYRSVQFKGVFDALDEDPGESDKAWVQQQREAFVAATSLLGDPPNALRNLWMDEVVRVSFNVEQAFNQTPGPEAGKPL